MTVSPRAAAGSDPGGVKNETVLLVALVALAVGFLAGVAFGVYRTGGQAMPGPTDAGVVTPQSNDPDLAALKEAVAQRTDDPHLWVELGHRHFDLGDIAAAIAAYEKALALRPDAPDPDVLTDLGVMYRRQGDPRKAVTTFERALAIAPRHEIALFNKGIVLLHDLNDVTGALESWQRLLAVNPTATTPGGQSLADLVRHVQGHQSEGATSP